MTETSLANHNRQSSLLRWIIGLALLALLLAGIAYALRGPVAAGVDEGASPAGNFREPTGEPKDEPKDELKNEPKNEPKNEIPRSLRQYAAARVDSSQRMC